MLAAMDWIFIAFVALLAIVLALAIGLVIDRERQLDAARDAALGGSTTDSESSRRMRWLTSWSVVRRARSSGAQRSRRSSTAGWRT
jgi:hypothetical protein